MARLEIAVLLGKDGTPKDQQGFFLREILNTVDGPRTRIVDGHYDTFERASAERQMHYDKDPS